MSEVVDITGMTFGRWLVVRRTASQLGYATWWCQCLACGNAVRVRGASLRSGKSTSCGCVRYIKGPRYRRHGAVSCEAGHPAPK